MKINCQTSDHIAKNIPLGNRVNVVSNKIHNIGSHVPDLIIGLEKPTLAWAVKPV